MSSREDFKRQRRDPAGRVSVLFGQDLVGALRVDGVGDVVMTNSAALRFLSPDETDVVGRKALDLVHLQDTGALREAMRLPTGSAMTLRMRVRDEDPWVPRRVAFIPGGDRQPGDVVMLIAEGQAAVEGDGSADRRRVDPLTRLSSRRMLLEALAAAVSQEVRGIALVVVNLDRFEAINDGLGQANGDAVLVEIAQRLRAETTGEDIAARVGADEFMLLLRGMSTRIQINARARGLLEAVAEPVRVGGLNIQVTASAGVAHVRAGERVSADEVVRRGKAALQAAKRGGRARFVVYDDSVARASGDRLRIETSLRDALEQDRLAVAYQPIRDLAAGTIIGAEALARWDDQRLGQVNPERFMPVAESSGLVELLTRFVLDQAIGDAARWRADSGLDAHVSVNLSGHDLTRRELPQEVAQALASHGLPPRALRLEITETAVVGGGGRVRANLLDLRALGVQVGIDDFGTGYSSMTYLKHLPVDFVKIDKTFVTGLGSDREDTAIVNAVIGLAKSLDLAVVAEGIETPTQIRLLREMGCDLGQGYLIGHAEPADVLLRILNYGSPASSGVSGPVVE